MPLPSRAMALPSGLLDKTATVYKPNTTTGAYDLVDRVDLPVALRHIGANSAPGGSERAELLLLRRLVWGPDYVMPDEAQVAIDSQRWQVLPGSYATGRELGDRAVFRSCDVQRLDG